MTKRKDEPRFKTMKLKIDPDRGVAQLALSFVPPRNYVFHSMERKDSEATIMFEKIAYKKPIGSLPELKLSQIEHGLQQAWDEASADLESITKESNPTRLSRKAVMEIAMDRFQYGCGYPRNQAYELTSLLFGLSDNALKQLSKKVFPAGWYRA